MRLSISCTPVCARACEMTISERAAALSELTARIARQTPEKQFGVIAERVQGLSQRMTLLYKQALEQKARALSELTLRITAASPEAALKRGYAIVRRGETKCAKRDHAQAR